MSNPRLSNRLASLMRGFGAALLTAASCWSGTVQAQTAVDLADVPVFSTVAVPGNLILALSVEFPTASTPAYFSSIAYTTSSSASSAGAVVSPYVGYFDPYKCYEYIYNSTTPEASYFTPRTAVSSTFGCTQSSTLPLWSGNYLNWATMQTLDVYRWALTGGARGTYSLDDTAASTIIQKTRHSGQGAGYFPDKDITSGITSATPFPSAWGTVRMQANAGTGWAVYFFKPGGATVTDYNGHNAALGASDPKYPSTAAKYRVWIRVKVCDTSSGLALESNCVKYGSNYKPEGLMQKYAMKLRYSAFGYLNDDSSTRDGGVMRARMKYVGPQKPVSGSTSVTNSATEWSETDGTYVKNPDPTDASSTTSATAAAGYAFTISNSGVLNYLNKFGTVETGNYKSYDPVSELYYAASRYYRNKGNVPEYTSLTGAGSLANLKRWVDGFPVITSWDDPIEHACQKNFILGIGDIYTWLDGNLYTSTLLGGQPAMPGSVSADKDIDITKATNMVGALEGKGTLGTSYKGGRNDTWFIAGMAYHMHTNDIRPDLSGSQTVSSYWLDVKENQTYESKNVYYLMAKYGGFTVPENYVAYPTSPTAWGTAQESWWYHTTDLVGSDKRPDNYFVADQGTAMVKSLNDAFSKMAAEASTTVSTAFTATSPRQSTGSVSYSTNYTPTGWTGQLQASTVTYDSSTGQPTYSTKWDARDALNSRSPTSRIIVTCCDNAGAGIPFQAADLAGTSFSRTNYASFSSVSGVGAASYTQADYVNYLRGDRSKEQSSASSSAASSASSAASSSSSSKIFRYRQHLLGDIVGSQSMAVGAPNYPYFETTNPGYTGFKRKYKDRITVVYAGANDGMLHAFDGQVSSASSSSTSSSSSSSCSSGGKCGYELFAYVPSFTYNGSGGTSSSAPSTGLASLGSATSFSHHFLVDATPQYFDIDVKRVGTTPNAVPTEDDWRSILIGGLGKGGKGYYALDITNPADWTSEAAVKGKVMWEFPSPSDTTTVARMGYSYGSASVVKTKKYGWTVVVTSGYNNSDGKGYFFFINPVTGALLETVQVSDTATEPLNLSGQTVFVPDYSDFTGDAVYAGDLKGNVWRVDISGTGTFTAEKFAELSNSGTTGSSVSSSSASSAASSVAVAASGTASRQSITVRPMVEVDPQTLKRYVIVGTGRLLADSDITANQIQSLYAMIDGKQSFGEFNKPISSVLKPSDLTKNTNLLTGIGSSPASDKGWYIDLTTTYIGSSSSSAASSSSTSTSSSSSSSSSSSTSSSGFVYAPRVITEMTANTGIIAVPVDRPSGEICDMNGDHLVLALALGTGKSVLRDASGNAVVSSGWIKGLSTNLAFINVGGKIRLLVGDTTATVTSVKGEFGSGAGLRRLNWREVPAVD
ncbi:pilus assembly protein [Viridibacterium curvum]|uniref:PilY1 beta-propeller domain-containing protein n=1 Tax=Viridibacterium curvum TaxID=1101404 RepID=A0ABP9Q7H3_9RHOO